MNREIKFRVWDSDQGKVLPVIWMFYDKNGQQWFGFQRVEAGPEPKFMEYCEASVSDPTVVLMQYTGLKDKNGREMYEGDVLRLYDAQSGFKGREPLPTHVDVVVVWSDYELAWRARRLDNGGLFCAGSTQAWKYYINEILGNAYENPELID